MLIRHTLMPRHYAIDRYDFAAVLRYAAPYMLLARRHISPGIRYAMPMPYA